MIKIEIRHFKFYKNAIIVEHVFVFDEVLLLIFCRENMVTMVFISWNNRTQISLNV